jgi:hypothetical protein
VQLLSSTSQEFDSIGSPDAIAAGAKGLLGRISLAAGEEAAAVLLVQLMAAQSC